MKIGLVGEAPLDTLSIMRLMLKKYSNLTFVELLKNKITGASLENQKTKTELRIECLTHKPDIVIFIRDLDGLWTKAYRHQILKRKNYYNDFKGCTLIKKTVFLLNIWELETLILSDIAAFNKFYGCNAQFNDNPMFIKEPKEFLSKLHSKYSNSHNSKILEHADFESIYLNCDYFKVFIEKFEKLL
ncbi:DUF4276 family protein [Elizabethkingia anophelis]|uniref:DUF4276 family protein n=1 Tax=Elizabethkingia anophelis TaxID=1117645 RepID=UPI00162A18CF|nr:DUF4276 family protein [Elizabethkingia anophelis]MCT4000334.1 hypothetical protein [Elizabethkingia anophelis]MCT4014685.1 hypothetical protein [Elizabethkingia anophelis]MCT4018246.1 hypothetical protein [Elizabethkingia anophelis]CAH1150074.1 hypothetical protein EAVVTKC53_03123 [Elizabethkingia anophelis]CAI9678616.1 hypothetical protein EAVVTKC53_00720 [Elizabethkingia anophelis]